MSTPSVSCRCCGRSDLKLVLSLGRMPPANSLLRAEQLDQPHSAYPLDLVFCPNCSLMQITETVPPEELFREYLYFSSFSETMLKHARQIARRLIEIQQLNAESLVVELASNDGYLLQYFVAEGIPVLGIEPALNVAKVAEDRGVKSLCEFFGKQLAQQLRREGQAADVIIANNVLAHVADLNGFVEGIGILLKETGVGVIEVPYVKDMTDRCEFDTIYHEHLCYFSLTSLEQLFRKHGLLIADVERIPVHGGSLRLFVGHKDSARVSSAVELLLHQEAACGVNRLDFYIDFRQKVEHIKNSLCHLLEGFKQQGKSIAAYGAAAKGSTLLNYLAIGKETLDFVVDRSTYKQGRYMPGVHLPIYAPEKLLEAWPDYVLLLTWNFADEILAQQAEFRKRGGRFVIPIPEPKVV